MRDESNEYIQVDAVEMRGWAEQLASAKLDKAAVQSVLHEIQAYLDYGTRQVYDSAIPDSNYVGVLERSE